MRGVPRGKAKVKIKIRWYNGDGSDGGTERTTLEEISTRMANETKTHTGQPGDKLVAIWRHGGTGEVARCYTLE
jgi:hypothetical protein